MNFLLRNTQHIFIAMITIMVNYSLFTHFLPVQSKAYGKTNMLIILTLFAIGYVLKKNYDSKNKKG